MEHHPEKPSFGPFINFFALDEGILRSNALNAAMPITAVNILKLVPFPAHAEVHYLFQEKETQSLG